MNEATPFPDEARLLAALEPAKAGDMRETCARFDAWIRELRPGAPLRDLLEACHDLALTTWKLACRNVPPVTRVALETEAEELLDEVRPAVPELGDFFAALLVLVRALRAETDTTVKVVQN